MLSRVPENGAGRAAAVLAAAATAGFLSAWMSIRGLQKRILRPAAGIQTSVQSLAVSGENSGETEWEDLGQVALQLDRFRLFNGQQARRFSELQKNFSALSEHMMEGVISVHRNREVAFINERAKNILELPAIAGAGAALIETVRDQRLDSLIADVIRSPKIVDEELELYHVRNKVIRIRAVGLPVGNEEDIAGILLFYDLTDMRRLENLRKDFVANVSHELKTPLTSIKGFLETLIEGGVRDPEKQRSFLQIMQEDANRLSRLIQDLLEISRLEGHKKALKKEVVSLRRHVQDVLEAFQLELAKKSIRADNRVANVTVPADPDQLKQVLVNLIDNAIKFNREKGSIVIDAESSMGEIRVGVHDSGVGIPEEATGRVFERFYRADKARSRDFGGTGLGLSIVKHVIENHGGKTWCISRPGEGSHFYFTLPLG